MIWAAKRKPVPTSPEIDQYNQNNGYVQHGPYQSVPLADRQFLTEESITSLWQPSETSVGGSKAFNTNITVASPSLSVSGSNHPWQPRSGSARWGINWLNEPLIMFLFALMGLGVAMGHHFYFQYLDGHLAPDDGVSSQQVVKQVGNAFVYLALACFRASIAMAYSQYIWTIFRRNALKISSIDKVFSLPSRLLSFFSLQLLRDAPFALVLGAVPWLLFLGGLTPAATLSVVPALHQQILPGQVPALNFSMLAWTQYQSMHSDQSMEPTAEIIKIVSESALNMKVEPPPAPALNSSYSIQFYGPTVQCSDPSSSQEADFEYFMDRYAEDANVFTVQQYESGRYNVTGLNSGPSDATVFGALVLSSFSPTVWLVNDRYEGIEADDFNNWVPNLDYSNSDDFNFGQKGNQDIWIQLSNQSIVCTAVNASFDIGFEFNQGVGSISYQNIRILPATGSDTDFNGTNALELGYDAIFTSNTTSSAYFTSFLALGSNIFGNLSLENTDEGCIGGSSYAGCPIWTLQVSTTRLALTGLVACDEIAHNAWYEQVHTPSDATNFPSEPWMCRNRSLARGVEDLANNLTISMLSSANFTTNVTTQITSFTTQNVYKYDKRNLFISYGAVIVVAAVVALTGLVSMVKNGTYHDESFSTIMATTRNPNLDALFRGACLGSTEDIAANKLMFGVLAQNESPDMKAEIGYNGYGGATRHVAFGLEGSVVRLRKRDTCS